MFVGWFYGGYLAALSAFELGLGFSFDLLVVPVWWVLICLDDLVIAA